jgi:hypothetical protein
MNNMAITPMLKKVFDMSNVRVKVVAVSMLMLYFCILIQYVATRFGTADPIPDLRVKMEKVREARLSTVRVRTGLFIKNIPLFDEIKNSFIIDSIIWFDFNHDELMLKTIEQFSIDNGKILYKSEPDIKVKDNRLFAKYNVLFEVRTDLRHYRFPFDDHRLSIILSNDFVTPDEMAFLVDRTSFGIAKNLFVSNWKIYDTNVNFGYSHLVIDQADKSAVTSAPKALFIINFVKAGFRKILIIFLPILAALFLSLCSFLMGITNTVGRLNLAIAGVTALLGYRFVIESMMPKVGYFTTTDEVYLVLLIIAFLCFMSQLLMTRYYSSMDEASRADKKVDMQQIKSFLEVLNNIIFVTMVTLLLGPVSYILLK